MYMHRTLQVQCAFKISLQTLDTQFDFQVKPNFLRRENDLQTLMM